MSINSCSAKLSTPQTHFKPTFKGLSFQRCSYNTPTLTPCVLKELHARGESKFFSHNTAHGITVILPIPPVRTNAEERLYVSQPNLVPNYSWFIQLKADTHGSHHQRCSFSALWQRLSVNQAETWLQEKTQWCTCSCQSQTLSKKLPLHRFLSQECNRTFFWTTALSFYVASTNVFRKP